jgi:hypothetical protein
MGDLCLVIKKSMPSLEFYYHPCFWNIMAAFGHTLIAEDLVFRDVNGCSEKLVLVSSERHPGSSCHSICTSVSEGCSKPCISISSPTILEGRTSDLGEELLVNSRSEVVESNYNYRGVPIFFQG